MRHYRRIIKVTAQDSPNVRLGLIQQRGGKTPTNEMVVEGVLSWDEYVKRLATWDKVRKCIGLDGEFWEGAEFLLFPPEWLNRANMLALGLRGMTRKAKGGGCDPAEGGDSTCMAAVDEFGLIELVSKKTPDTHVIAGEAIAFMYRHSISPENFCMDAGGGGKQIADTLRAAGYPVRIVAFGSGSTLEVKYNKQRLADRREVKEDKTVYKNRRAEMYWELSELMNPGREHEIETVEGEVFKGIAGTTDNAMLGVNSDTVAMQKYKGFAIPAYYTELRRQLAPFPKTWDGEGKAYIIPKSKPSPTYIGQTLIDLIGCSPDEADALALATHGMLHPKTRVMAGTF